MNLPHKLTWIALLATSTTEPPAPEELPPEAADSAWPFEPDDFVEDDFEGEGWSFWGQ